MLSSIGNRLTFANVTSVLALFVALGGASYAAVTLPRNSVGSQEIKRSAVKAPEVAKDAVRRSEIRANAVGTSEVADGSLLGRDFASGEIPAGPRGERGLQGEPGTPGEDATNLFAYILDQGSTSPAVVQYGSGVTGVIDPDGNSGYTVNFDRPLENCVVLANSGKGNPSGAAAGGVATGHTTVGDTVAGVSFHNGGPAEDTSFMIAAFC